MNSKDLEKYIGYSNLSIVEAMQKIDMTGNGILFIVDYLNQLIGTLTDGDIRRWLIKTGNLNASVSEVMNRNPCFLYETDSKQAVKVMTENKMRALPIINIENRVVDIVFNIYDESVDSSKMSSALKDVPVVIMAGGKGTRLQPYTNILPKPLIPIGNKPILEHIIEQFNRFGCEKFYLILNYKKNMIKAYFNELDHRYQIQYIDETEPLGTGGGLSLLRDKIDGTFFLSNCDILIKDDFYKMYQFHQQSGNKISMICSVKNFKLPYGVVHTGSQGIVESMEEKPTVSFFTNTGCYIIDSEILKEIPVNTSLGIPEIIDTYRKKGNQVRVYPIKESAWLDMGQIDELENMKRRLERI